MIFKHCTISPCPCPLVLFHFIYFFCSYLQLIIIHAALMHYIHLPFSCSYREKRIFRLIRNLKNTPKCFYMPVLCFVLNCSNVPQTAFVRFLLFPSAIFNWTFIVSNHIHFSATTFTGIDLYVTKVFVWKTLPLPNHFECKIIQNIHQNHICFVVG